MRCQVWGDVRPWPHTHGLIQHALRQITTMTTLAYSLTVMKSEFTAWSPLILGQSQAYTSHDDETALHPTGPTSRTFSMAGEYTYFCGQHSSMQGKIIVE